MDFAATTGSDSFNVSHTLIHPHGVVSIPLQFGPLLTHTIRHVRKYKVVWSDQRGKGRQYGVIYFPLN
jgi:hypothetical protein